MILSRHAGMTKEAAHTLLTLLHWMKYYVRTAYGVASEAFSNLHLLILGVMQGGGHSRCLWALTSSIMFDQMENTTGADFYSPHPQRGCQRIGEAFVDDTTLWILQMGLLLVTLINLMSISAQQWERLLFATGGALNLQKCFWYGIEWQFSPAGEPKMNKTHDDGPQITLTSGSNPTPTIIQRIKVTKGQRTLGVRLAPDGNEASEYAHRLDQATQI